MAGDAYAKQVLALGAYADMLVSDGRPIAGRTVTNSRCLPPAAQDLRGNSSGANATRATAAALQARFSSTWYNASTGFARGFNAADGFLWGYADTNSIFPASSYMLGSGGSAAAQAQIDLIVAAAPGAGTEVRTLVSGVLPWSGACSLDDPIPALAAMSPKCSLRTVVRKRLRPLSTASTSTLGTRTPRCPSRSWPTLQCFSSGQRFGLGAPLLCRSSQQPA